MQPKVHDQESVQSATPIVWIRLLLTYLFILLALWLSAWDLDWWQAWAFSLIFLISGIGGRAWAERRNPGLLAERQSLQTVHDAMPWDRVLAPLVGVSISFPLLIVAGLDHRHRWSPIFPIWLNIFGLVIVTIGYLFAVWALTENRFFSSMVHIQADRGHFVCDSGPYRIIRHPGYAGNLLPLVGIALALDSLWTLIPAAVAVIIIVIRTALEDRVLLEELSGYREYARRVRYRLVPGIY
jgi:protein-S-isoprenylcysteine O-methyltransferase Ste14